jgi:acyl-CoA thioester hydrolase
MSRMVTQYDHPLRVRYCETDPMGVVHHANYLVYFELARTEMLRAAGGNYRKMEEDGLRVVVARAECKYRKPARYDDELTIRVMVSRLTPAKIEHTYLVLRDHEVLAEAKILLAVVDTEGKVQRVPEFLGAV